jgi:nucleotide-binding universal stress UspA family protein
VTGRIVVGIDGSDCSARTLEFVVHEARLRGCDLEAVHVWEFPCLAYSPFVPTPYISESELEAASQTVLDKSLAAIDTTGFASPIDS